MQYGYLFEFRELFFPVETNDLYRQLVRFAAGARVAPEQPKPLSAGHMELPIRLECCR